jgi:nucleotide-binding universal stress UspA family protein
MKVKTILVPTDFSKNAQVAFDHAFELAQQTGAKLILLHVQSDSSFRTAVREGLALKDLETKEKIRNEVDTLIKSRFSEMLAGYQTAGVNMKPEPLRGDPDAVICGYGKSIRADLIIMGARGASLGEKVRKAFLGSVTQSVINKSMVPVLVITEKMRRNKSFRAKAGA